MLEAEETSLGPLFSFSAKTSVSDQAATFLDVTELTITANSGPCTTEY